jgi:hypothetical protein
MFVACQDIECNMSEALFVDDKGTVIASIRAIYTSTNDTINAVVRMAQSSQAEVDTFTFVEPTLIK